MSAVLVDGQSARPHVRAVTDGRPPGRMWSAEEPSDEEQPTLTFEAGTVDLCAPLPVGYRVHVVAPTWMRPSTTSAALPDARSWSASLALAVAETLQGRRPVGQLSRWVDERVLATVNMALRSHRSAFGRAAPAAAHRPALLRSVHLQFPQPDVVEASAHLQLAERSTALALRLEAWHDRWLCTALELGPRDEGL